MPQATGDTQRRTEGERRRPLSGIYDPLVRGVGRLPAPVHTKLLVAFVGTSVLLLTVGLLGLRVLGQSNDRVGSVGPCSNEPLRTASFSVTRGRSACSSRRTRRLPSTRSGRAGRPDMGRTPSGWTWPSRTP